MEFDLRVDSIAAGGDGVGRHDGMVTFVPRTAPGDVAHVIAVRDGRLLRARLDRIVKASPDRTDPPCDHYTVDRCGGCQLQHLIYEGQVQAKAGIIFDSMTRIGRVKVDRPVVEPSDKPWRYRRKLTLALRRNGGRLIAGLHRFDAPEEVFELRDCPITEEAVLAAWAQVLEHQHFFPADPRMRGAVRLFEQGFSFTLETDSPWPQHEPFFAAIPGMTELWWSREGNRPRLVQKRGDSRQAGAAFVQVNAGVALRLREWVLSRAEPHRPQTAIDAYSGTGDIAVALAGKGARVTAIEIDRSASNVCAARLPAGSRAVSAPVEQALPSALPADLVVLNPPRAGIDARVARQLDELANKPRALLYVSCNPATLARDVNRMPSYRIRSLRGFDMFPQTAHVETVCELEPAA